MSIFLWAQHPDLAGLFGLTVDSFFKWNLNQKTNCLLEMAPVRVVVDSYDSYLHFCTAIDDDDDDDDVDDDNWLLLKKI